jgi:hypothetical protein
VTPGLPSRHEALGEGEVLRLEEAARSPNGIRTRVSTLRGWLVYRSEALSWAFGASAGPFALLADACSGKSVGGMLAELARP